MTKFLNISTDTTLGGSSASDEVVSSQKALKTYIDNNGGSSYTAGTGIDITSNTISVKDPVLINKSTQQDSYVVTSFSSGLSTTIRHSVAFGYGSEPLSDFSTAIGDNSGTSSGVSGSGQTAIGYGSFVGGAGSIAIGYQATAGMWPLCTAAIAIGDRATATANYAIQLGFGSNSEANSFYVGTSFNNNWKLLGSDGLIPSGRIPISISVDSSSTNNTVVGSKLFYDTCGDIETLINAL